MLHKHVSMLLTLSQTQEIVKREHWPNSLSLGCIRKSFHVHSGVRGHTFGDSYTAVQEQLVLAVYWLERVRNSANYVADCNVYGVMCYWALYPGYSLACTASLNIHSAIKFRMVAAWTPSALQPFYIRCTPKVTHVLGTLFEHAAIISRVYTSNVYSIWFTNEELHNLYSYLDVQGFGGKARRKETTRKTEA
jgi:hypothetical protein